MLGRRKRRNVKESLAVVGEVARDQALRQRLASALAHVAAAGGRAGAGVRGAADRLTSDKQLLAELRAARDDLQRAYGRAKAKKRKRRFRRLLLFAALASIAGLPQLRRRLAGIVGHARRPSGSSRLEDLTKDELYARAQAADIAGRSEMSKDELISALRAQNG